MRPGKADIYLYLKDRKASTFDGVLGVLPDGQTGEVVITGDVRLNLINALKQGETINLRWQRLRPSTPQLDFQFTYPFLFRTPLGVDFRLNLYRRDTLFSQTQIAGGLEYYLPGSNKIRVYVESQGANVLSSEPLNPDEFVDSRTLLFGLGGEFRNLDYRFNPRKGFYTLASIAAGTKEIFPDPGLDESVYADIALETNIYNINLDAGNYFSLGRRSTILLRAQVGAFVNENMFRNEVYRIGGLKTLRGFDEQAIFASQFFIGTLEYRFILEQNSNLFVFFDQGFYEDKARDEAISDTPFGFGAGVNFETNAGVFSLTYALGREFDNQISFRSGKVHFGFLSFF
jgi:hypothetical protein